MGLTKKQVIKLLDNRRLEAKARVSFITERLDEAVLELLDNRGVKLEMKYGNPYRYEVTEGYLILYRRHQEAEQPCMSGYPLDEYDVEHERIFLDDNG